MTDKLSDKQVQDLVRTLRDGPHMARLAETEVADVVRFMETKGYQLNYVEPKKPKGDK